MGYSTRSSIRTFTPDNTANTLYIRANYQTVEFSDLIEQIKNHFGEDSKLEDFSIGAEHIQTDCLGYDRYDSCDWENFLIIERK